MSIAIEALEAHEHGADGLRFSHLARHLAAPYFLHWLLTFMRSFYKRQRYWRPATWLATSAAAAILIMFCPRPASAEEPSHEKDFVHAMQKEGLGEESIEYLRLLQKKGMPDDLKETFDLEMCNSLRAAANEVSADQAQKYLVEAQADLDKFLKEKPDHPAVAGALLESANFDSIRAMEKLSQAKAATPGPEQDQMMADARATFELARPRYQTAIDYFLKQRTEYKKDLGDKKPAAHAPASAPKTPPRAARRPPRTAPPTAVAVDPRVVRLLEVTADWLEAQRRMALIDFQVSQTYVKLDDPARTKSLQAANGAFYKIIEFAQSNPEVGNFPPVLWSKLWQARTTMELGKPETALDILDECEALGGDDVKITGKTLPFIVEFLAQVEYFKCLALNKKSGPEAVIPEATRWRSEKIGWNAASGFQGTTFELIKAKIDVGDKTKKTAEYQQAMILLNEMGKVPSEYTAQAIKLKSTLGAKIGGGDVSSSDVTVKNFEEALEVARAQMRAKKYDEAVKLYDKAMEMSPTAKDKADVAKAKSEQARASYASLASKVADVDKIKEPKEASEKITELMGQANSLAQEQGNPMAAAGGALAVRCALWLYQHADEASKPDAVTKLQTAAQAVIDKWPNTGPEGDARLYLYNLHVTGATPDFKAALADVEGMNSASPRYPTAMQAAANLHWRVYSEEMKKPEGERDADVLKTESAAARKSLEQGLVALHRAEPSGLSQQMVEMTLFQGQILQEMGKPKEAVEAIAPLLALLKPNEPIDGNKLKISTLAVRCYVKLDEFDKAEKVATYLVEAGDDAPQANSALVAFARQVNNEVKKARADVENATSNPDPKVMDAAQDKLRRNQALLGKLLDQLASRARMSSADMLYVGETCADLDKLDKAKQIFEQLMQNEIHNDRMVLALKARLIGIDRKKGDFKGALQGIEALLKTVPAMDLLTERGRVLQAWAEKERDAKHIKESADQYERAANQWGNIRYKLGARAEKSPEYYEAVYNEAACLVARSKLPGADKSKAAGARKQLASVLLLNSKLDGPDTVAKYQSLLKEIDKLVPPAK